MGKDFKAGLIAGAVLAGAALIWVATRPSLSPQARMPRTVQSPVESAKTNDLVGANNDHPPLPGPVPSPAPKSASSGIPFEKPLAPASVAAGQPPTGGSDLTVYEMNEPIKTTRFHIVRRGETLSAISQQYYGTKEKWQKILAANSKTVKDPNKIAPGTKLIIPE